MTPIQPTPSTELTSSAYPPVNPAGERTAASGRLVRRIDLRTRVRGSRHSRLDEILLAVAVNALGPNGRVAVAREDWLRVVDAIHGPVSAAATAALERPAADLEATLPQRIPELVRRVGDHRLRTEFDYD